MSSNSNAFTARQLRLERIETAIDTAIGILQLDCDIDQPIGAKEQCNALSYIKQQ